MSGRSRIVKSLVTKLNEIAATQKFSTAGSAVPTFGNLIDLFNASLKGATASLDGSNDLRITNATGGSGSKIVLKDTGSRRLFSSLSGFVKIKNAVDGTDPTNGYQRVHLTPSSTKQTDPTGLTAGTTYTATITIDGIANPVSLLGSTATNYNALVVKLESLIGGCTVKFLGSSGKIEIKSSTTGTTSTVSIADTGANKLFNSLTHFDTIPTAVAGLDPTVGYQVVELTGTPTVSSFTGLINFLMYTYVTYTKT